MAGFLALRINSLATHTSPLKDLDRSDVCEKAAVYLYVQSALPDFNLLDTSLRSSLPIGLRQSSFSITLKPIEPDKLNEETKH